MALNLGSISIPINAATKTFAILAKRGAGKTYTGGVMAEEFFQNNIPFVVFDPIDVWWGLRLRSNGKDAGLPVVVFGIEHSDIKLDRDMGPKIAQAVIKENVSCVISTFGLPKVAQRHLIQEFSEEILNINNSPRHIFIEEAHEYVPQKVTGAMGKVFNSVSNLVVMGRNRGLGVTLLNQRAATVNKDVLTQIDTLIAMRSVGPQDRKALKEWVEAHAAEGDFEAFISSLPALPTGEGWIWSPEFLGLFKKIKIRERQTFHPDREKLGEKFEMPELSRIDVQSFIERFKSSEDIKQEAKMIASKVSEEPVYDDAYIINLRNEYESKLVAVEAENKRLNQILYQIQNVIGIANSGEGLPINIPDLKIHGNNDVIQMWLSKLGNGGAARIFKFLADQRPRKFTRSKIGLAVGLQSSSGSFSTYLSKLRSNKLIIKEGSEFMLNPDL